MKLYHKEARAGNSGPCRDPKRLGSLWRLLEKEIGALRHCPRRQMPVMAGAGAGRWRWPDLRARNLGAAPHTGQETRTGSRARRRPMADACPLPGSLEAQLGAPAGAPGRPAPGGPNRMASGDGGTPGRASNRARLGSHDLHCGTLSGCSWSLQSKPGGNGERAARRGQHVVRHIPWNDQRRASLGRDASNMGVHLPVHK